MNVTDIPVSALALAQCRAILGGEYDPLRSFWDRSSERRRRVLLSLAERSSFFAAYAWRDLPGHVRGPLRGTLRQVRDVLNSMPAEAFEEITPRAIPSNADDFEERGVRHGR